MSNEENKVNRGNIGNSFLLVILITLVSSLLVVITPVFVLLGRQISMSALHGLLLATMGALIWFFMAKWGFKGSNKSFMISIFGGMLIRLVVFGLVILILVKIYQIHLAGFLVSLFVYFVFFQLIEIRYIIKANVSTSTQKL